MTDKKKNIFFVLLSLVLGIVIGVGSFGIANSVNKSGQSIATIEQAKKGISNDNDSEAKAVKGVSLLSATTYAASQGVSKTLTAEIKPSDALNKKVDWTITWKDSSVTEDISNYLTVTPTSDGSLTATVTCSSSFRGKEAIATVTTREGGFSASCYISYVGKVSSVSVNNNVEGTCNMGGTASYPVTLSNVFNDVGEEFYDELEVTGFTLHGTCSTAQKLVLVGGTVYYSNIQNWVSIEDLTYRGTANISNFFSVSISDGTLNIITPLLSDVYSSYSPSGAGNQGIYYDCFYGDWDGYAEITVACGSLTTTFFVNLIVDVESVSVTGNVQF